MDIDEDDDFYAPEEPQATTAQSAPETTSTVPATAPAAAPAPAVGTKAEPNEELEEGEEEEEDEGGEMDEDDDSDVDIIIERKDGSKPSPLQQSRYSEIRNIPQRSTANETAVKVAPIKKEEPRQSQADLPPVSTSKVDVNVIPIHKPTGKPLTQVNIDEDLAENDKPWRKPGTDLSDYFNYGFDEFTWALYAQKQEALRGEYSQEAVAQNNKKMLEEMTNMMMMGGMMPGLPGAPGGAAPSAAPGPAMPGLDGIPPEMQAMMQQMMAGGMDPSQMDVGAMSSMFAGMQNTGGAGGAGGQGVQGQNFGAGFGGNQGQGYGGYDQSMGGGGGAAGGGGGGGRGNRGRGARRWM
ncbi:Fip1 domain-containing protein [Apodospora peruviana]|uniref:Fip1 domain-containing protein n=1 Tax=Apodospora peruviana TaxID=516989 RepID=A0AAE0I439_9PEZI|nr:Fip1 domain-containing protein [Apodospora peruviana]